MKSKRLLSFLLVLLLASCNDGGIVGTGDGDAELSGEPGSLDGEDSASLDSDNQPRLPKLIVPATPQALLNNGENVAFNSTTVLQNAFRERRLRHLKIQLELLYLESAYDAILAFCTSTNTDETCQLAGTSLNVVYSPAVAEAEQALLVQMPLGSIAATTEPTSTAEKIGTQIPLGNVRLKRSNEQEFQNHLSASRLDSSGMPIVIDIDWSDTGDAQRIHYQVATDAQAGETGDISSLLIAFNNQVTERVATLSTSAQEIFLLTIAGSQTSDQQQFIQADWRNASSEGYQHVSWDGQATTEGAFLHSRISSDPMLQLPTSVRRSILNSQGNIVTVELCDDSLSGTACADNSTLWQTLENQTGEDSNSILTSPLFLNDQELQSWKSSLPDSTLNTVSANIETVVLVPLNQTPGSHNQIVNATRNIAGAKFRQYGWNIAIVPTQRASFEESLRNDTIQYTSINLEP